jgi:SNF2 family DNA or RNA helicase
MILILSVMRSQAVTLRSPDGLARIEPGPALQATLRPYQQAAVRWLYLLHRLRLGACLTAGCKVIADASPGPCSIDHFS